MPTFPSGTVTFLFTDIEGGTERWERDQTVMGLVVECHHALMRTAIETHHGVLFKCVGDTIQAAFFTAPDAVAAALDAQRSLVTDGWPEVMAHLPSAWPCILPPQASRPGLPRSGLNRLARLVAAAHGGQVLLTQVAQNLACDALPPGASLRDLGEHPLRDLNRPEHVFQLLHADLIVDFPPIRTLTPRPNNLPVEPTLFLGREDHVARIVDLLSRDDVRLLTITGPAVSARPAWALQVAAGLLDDFPDGVWFIDLSALDDPTLVPSAIARVLGVREEGVGCRSA